MVFSILRSQLLYLPRNSFGQKRDVFIHKLSLVDTVEERILALQEKKRALSKAALEGTKLKKSKDEKADMRFLMGMFGAEI